MSIQVGCGSCSHMALTYVSLCLSYPLLDIFSLLDCRHTSVCPRIASFSESFLATEKEPGYPHVCDCHCQELLCTTYLDRDFVLVSKCAVIIHLPVQALKYRGCVLMNALPIIHTFQLLLHTVDTIFYETATLLVWPRVP